jgi:hypothetical protein
MSRNLTRLIDRAIWQWTVWRMRCERERLHPELKAIRLRKEACRKQHRRGIVESEKAASAVLHEKMMRGA